MERTETHTLESLGIIPNDGLSPEEQEKAYNYEQALKYCGSNLTGINPENGARYKFTVKCGYWRECPRCFNGRVEMFMTRAAKAQIDAGMNFRVAIVSQAQSTKMTRKLKKLNYWRIPLEDGSVVLLYDAFVAPKLEHIPELVDFESLDWNEITMTPYGKRYTGDLGRPEEPEKEEALAITINCPKVEDLKATDEECAWEEACKQTNYLNPTYDENDIMWAIGQRMDAFRKEVLKRKGVIAYDINRYTKVRKSCFCSWKTGELVYGPGATDPHFPIEEMTSSEPEEVDVGAMIEAAQAGKELSEAAKAEEELFGF
jgi:hypothetical protein